MNFEDFYKKFEEEAKKLLGTGLWDKGTAVSCPKEFAKELFDSDAFDDPSDVAKEYAELIQEMDKEGSLGEGKCEGAPCGTWAVEYKDIWDEQTVERFDDENEAWARYNELESRTFGDMSDILWVKEPKCLADECGSSASSLGTAPTGGTEKDEAEGKDDFLATALAHTVLSDGEETIYVKLDMKDVYFRVIALMPDGSTKTLSSGALLDVTDYYRSLVGMPDAEAIALIEEA